MATPPLDLLYGTGAAVSFSEKSSLTALFPGAVTHVTEAGGTNGVYAEVRWTDTAASEAPIASAVLYLGPKRIHYAGLTVSPGYKAKGVTTHFVLALLSLYASWGVEILTAQPQTPRAEYLLALIGFHEVEREGVSFFASRVGVTDRMAEYREWVVAGRPAASEPVWHKFLREHPLAGLELY